MLSLSEQSHSEERYLHHHTAWGKAYRQGDWRRAKQHLYALRAHLRNLGWLAQEYDRPGLGVWDRDRSNRLENNA